MQSDSINIHERTKHRAYELWVEHGRLDGHETEFWLQAERELNSEGNSGLTRRDDPMLRSGTGSDGPR